MAVASLVFYVVIGVYSKHQRNCAHSVTSVETIEIYMCPDFYQVFYRVRYVDSTTPTPAKGLGRYVLVFSTVT